MKKTGRFVRDSIRLWPGVEWNLTFPIRRSLATLKQHWRQMSLSLHETETETTKNEKLTETYLKSVLRRCDSISSKFQQHPLCRKSFENSKANHSQLHSLFTRSSQSRDKRIFQLASKQTEHIERTPMMQRHVTSFSIRRTRE